MQVWVDADACPKVIKEILFRFAIRKEVTITLIANQYIRTPVSPFIQFQQVADGPDIADDEIAMRCDAGDLVVTADIPLAARIVEKGGFALDPRGKMYDRENIKQILGMRDFMDSLRGSGLETGGPGGFDARAREMFANHLDRFFAKTPSK